MPSTLIPPLLAELKWTPAVCLSSPIGSGSWPRRRVCKRSCPMSVEAMVQAIWWNEFGFSESPYLTQALSSERGSKLLVGRDAEVGELIEQLASRSRVPLLIGDNGV